MRLDSEKHIINCQALEQKSNVNVRGLTMIAYGPDEV